MARDLKIDWTTGDLAVVNGNFVLIDGIEAIAQSVRCRLQMFEGEWFLDETDGMPYFQTILVKNPNMDAIREAFRKRILGTVGVKDLLTLDLSYTSSARTLRVSFRASTDEGELSQTVEVTV